MENSILGQCPENAAAYDYRMYDRIWQRVSPELDPYPEVRAETAGAVPPAPAEPPAPAPVPAPKLETPAVPAPVENPAPVRS